MIKKIMGFIDRLIELHFIRFCIVGVSGFIINAFLLNIFHVHFKLNIFISQLIASEIALLSNFMLHDKWTYKSQGQTSTIKGLIVKFHITSWVAILGGSLIVTVLSRIFNLKDIISLAIASTVVLIWNFLWTKYYVWKRHYDDIE